MNEWLLLFTEGKGVISHRKQTILPFILPLICTEINDLTWVLLTCLKKNALPKISYNLNYTKPKIRHFIHGKRKFGKKTEFHSDSDNNASEQSLVKIQTITQTLKTGEGAEV